ncbi:hypothetical protein J8A00_21250 [Vibrio parahaemolyticus]|nr:hypothetical protein [Vibrio parahaemolyticus]
MDVFLSLLFIVVLFSFVAGLIKPAWIKQETRGRVLKFYGLGMLVLLLLIGLVADPVEQAPAVAKGEAASVATNSESSPLVENFCYALQAAMMCDGLQMRIDTEAKIENIVGGKIRGPSSEYNQSCMAGLDMAFKQENDGLCENAWRDFGCSGDKVKGLIQESSKSGSGRELCEFEG